MDGEGALIHSTSGSLRHQMIHFTRSASGLFLTSQKLQQLFDHSLILLMFFIKWSIDACTCKVSLLLTSLRLAVDRLGIISPLGQRAFTENSRRGQ